MAIKGGRSVREVVDTEVLEAGSVTIDHLDISSFKSAGKMRQLFGSGSRGGSSVANGSISAAKLAASAVITAKINDGAITLAKLSAGVASRLEFAAAMAGSALHAPVRHGSVNFSNGKVVIGTPGRVVKAVTSAHDVVIGEASVYLGNATGGAFSVNLPAAADAKHLVYTIKKVDSSGNAVTVDGDGSETIDGATTKDLSSQWSTVTIVSSGSGWLIISQV